VGYKRKKEFVKEMIFFLNFFSFCDKLISVNKVEKEVYQ